ncbi:transcriptional regulators containing an AAA-type ATPase domain and a DNA-binding domain [Saprospira grandis DSM 2844]|uniref:Transcriptional regulators containing an AAA-type ATPase domain and a DNA-binding domain n=1 Tax=Saprospira grandis DSM 2844 TaxID=694433 RepID=J0XZW2_9BACT|nr:sigma 54-interacting transcriptional regulator [Saprospira grandis]EJF54776.1 transcriptional regulators containing an AAA-type ATPase domain and a DNA-binding domain [Saprospira grandis DSM 2844]
MHKKKVLYLALSNRQALADLFPILQAFAQKGVASLARPRGRLLFQLDQWKKRSTFVFDQLHIFYAALPAGQEEGSQKALSRLLDLKPTTDIAEIISHYDGLNELKKASLAEGFMTILGQLSVEKQWLFWAKKEACLGPYHKGRLFFHPLNSELSSACLLGLEKQIEANQSSDIFCWDNPAFGPWYLCCQLLIEQELLSSANYLFQALEGGKGQLVLGRMQDKLLPKLREQLLPKLPRAVELDLVQSELQTYLKQGFSILLLGERGSGKNHQLEQLQTILGAIPRIHALAINEEDSMIPKLFGQEGQIGLFEEADGGALIIEELQHLSIKAQLCLMQAISTDRNNYFKGNGGLKRYQFRLIFTTSLDLKELKSALLPSFFDRIAQLRVSLPALRNQPQKIITAWQSVWKKMRFAMPCPDAAEFLLWLQQQELKGNYRDLEQIAIAYKAFFDFPKELQKRKGPEVLDWLKKEFDQPLTAAASLPQQAILNYLLPPEAFLKTESNLGNKLLNRFRRLLLEWAKEVESPRDFLGISSKTVHNWKNTADKKPPSF